MKIWAQQIEVIARKSLPLNLVREADFILDLVTFRVLKHRYGSYSVTPQEAANWLTEYLDNPYSRILLLID